MSPNFTSGSRGLGSASITEYPHTLLVTCDLVYTAHESATQLFRLIGANNGINMQIPLKGFQIDHALAQPHLARLISQSLKDIVCPLPVWFPVIKQNYEAVRTYLLFFFLLSRGSGFHPAADFI